MHCPAVRHSAQYEGPTTRTRRDKAGSAAACADADSVRDAHIERERSSKNCSRSPATPQGGHAASSLATALSRRWTVSLFAGSDAQTPMGSPLGSSAEHANFLFGAADAFT